MENTTSNNVGNDDKFEALKAEAKEHLSAAEEHLCALTEAGVVSPVGLMICNLDGKFLDAHLVSPVIGWYDDIMTLLDGDANPLDERLAAGEIMRLLIMMKSLQQGFVLHAEDLIAKINALEEKVKVRFSPSAKAEGVEDKAEAGLGAASD